MKHFAHAERRIASCKRNPETETSISRILLRPAGRDGHSSKRRNPRGLITSRYGGMANHPPPLNLVLHQPRFTKPPQLPTTLVGSYPTVSPLPPFTEATEGGLLSVALSLGRPRLRLTADMLYGVPTFLHSCEQRPSGDLSSRDA